MAQENLPFEPNVMRVSAGADGTQMVRTPTVIKTINAVAIAAETTIWTPAAGKKFRFMGYYFAADAGISMIIRDNTAGTVIMRLPNLGANFLQSTPMNFGNGILSAAANNVLTIIGSGAGNITGYVYGTEE